MFSNVVRNICEAENIRRRLIYQSWIPRSMASINLSTALSITSVSKRTENREIYSLLNYKDLRGETAPNQWISLSTNESNPDRAKNFRNDYITNV